MKSGQLQINELTTILNQHFQWNKARMACFVGMLIALMGVNTVNLTQLALSFPSRAQVPSRYRRMQRFFSGHRFDYNAVAHFIMKLFGFTDTDCYLSLDRTNWKWGSVNINLLVLAVVYRGAAIPVYWLPLNKRGNSNSRERIALIQRFIGQFDKGRIKGLLADREFMGDQWMGWLIKQRIPFIIRIRNNSISTNSQGQKTRVDQLFYTLKPGEIKHLSQLRPLGQCKVYLSALRLADGELLIVASGSFVQDAIKVYGLRWEIETLFGCLKGRGFKLEETRVVSYLRIKKLLVLPVIAFCWAHKVGDWKHDCVLPIKVKKHRRRAQSIFRYGLDYIRAELFNVFSRSLKQLRKLFSLLAPTPPPALPTEVLLTAN
jgi:Transposase DDE domain